MTHQKNSFLDRVLIDTSPSLKGKCIRCGKRRKLTNHSLTGKHKPPYVLVCRDCHNNIHKKLEDKK